MPNNRMESDEVRRADAPYFAPHASRQASENNRMADDVREVDRYVRAEADEILRTKGLQALLSDFGGKTEGASYFTGQRPAPRATCNDATRGAMRFRRSVLLRLQVLCLDVCVDPVTFDRRTDILPCVDHTFEGLVS